MIKKKISIIIILLTIITTKCFAMFGSIEVNGNVIRLIYYKGRDYLIQKNGDERDDSRILKVVDYPNKGILKIYKKDSEFELNYNEMELNK